MILRGLMTWGASLYPGGAYNQDKKICSEMCQQKTTLTLKSLPTNHTKYVFTLLVFKHKIL